MICKYFFQCVNVLYVQYVDVFQKKIYVLAILSVTVLDPISFRPDNIVSQIFKILISLSYTQNKSNGSSSSF